MEIFEHFKVALAWWTHRLLCMAGFLVQATEEDVRRALSLVEFRSLTIIQENCAKRLGVRPGRVSGLLLTECLYGLARSGEVEVVEVTIRNRKGWWRCRMYKLTGNKQLPGGRRVRPILWAGSPVPQLAPSSAYAPRSFLFGG